MITQQVGREGKERKGFEIDGKGWVEGEEEWTRCCFSKTMILGDQPTLPLWQDLVVYTNCETPPPSLSSLKKKKKRKKSNWTTQNFFPIC